MTANCRVEIYISFTVFLWHMYFKLESLTKYNHWDVNPDIPHKKID